ncbi:MAG TPA: MarR family transcriptional regulator, partial [Thermoplasmata archaeon]|nr:MarR family transcriptional regulator [Thermoplasmata archaeon]
MTPPKPPEATPSREQMLLEAMRLATVSFRRWIGEVLTERDLTMGQFWTLTDIGDHEPVNASHLATLRCVTPPTVSVMVEDLVHDGLVARNPSPTDRRVVVLSLTPRGRETLGTVWRHIGARMGEATRRLPQRDVESAVRVLGALESQARAAA